MTRRSAIKPSFAGELLHARTVAAEKARLGDLQDDDNGEVGMDWRVTVRLERERERGGEKEKICYYL